MAELRLNTRSNELDVALVDVEQRLSQDSLQSATSRFRKDERGGIMVLFTFLIIPMIVIVGFAMEFALTEFNRTRLQATTDAAGLASADLEQTLQPRAVVEDYFARAGLTDYLGDIAIVEDDNGRTVSIDAEFDQPGLLTRLAGIDNWDIPVDGAANESRGDIEIAVVLDNSTSMSWEPGATSGPPSDPSRMDLLIPAAKSFVDAVQPEPGEKGSTTISIVPFATQVSPGADLLSYFTVSSEHSTSNCVTFGSNADFRTPVISRTSSLQRTAHHDPVSNADYGWGLNPDWTVCPTDTDRNILPWSENVDKLKEKIDAMEPYGYTSIEIGTKWGVALLDPSFAPIVTSLAGIEGYEYLEKPAARGTPLNYTQAGVRKYLIVMSDGENTNNWDIREGYRSGNSPVWKLNGTNNYAYRRFFSGNAWYFRTSTGTWHTSPGSGADRMTWQEVWGEMSVRKFVDDIKRRADTRKTSDEFFNEIVNRVGRTAKNNRTQNICNAAKNAGIEIFTIGMDTYGQGDTTLRNCATTTNNFYDINGLDIAKAFESIARQINALKLTQ